MTDIVIRESVPYSNVGAIQPTCLSVACVSSSPSFATVDPHSDFLPPDPMTALECRADIPVRPRMERSPLPATFAAKRSTACPACCNCSGPLRVKSRRTYPAGQAPHMVEKRKLSVLQSAKQEAPPTMSAKRDFALNNKTSMFSAISSETSTSDAEVAHRAIDIGVPVREGACVAAPLHGGFRNQTIR